jgi:putative transcriptional regulator
MIKNRLREFRARYRMTQEDLAKSAGVSRQTIIAIENERYLPSISLAFKLAKIFGVSIEELLTYNEEPRPADSRTS